MKTGRLKAIRKLRLNLFMMGYAIAFSLSLHAQNIEIKPIGSIPSFDAEILLPRIKKNNEALLFAFKHTRSGYFEQKNYDTNIYRIEVDGSGKIESAQRFNRMLNGEILSGEYFAIPGDTVSRIVSVSDGNLKTSAKITSIPNGMIVEGDGWNKKYYKNNITSFIIEEELFSGITRTTWENAAIFSASIQTDGDEYSKGFFSVKAPGEYTYNEFMNKDRSKSARYSLQVWKSGDECRVRLDEVEPSAELYSDGMGRIFISQKNALYNFVFLDTVLSQEGRVSPLLILFFFGIL